MIRSARPASGRTVAAIAGLVLSMLMAAPIAHADTLADIRGTVTRDRANAHCPELHYSDQLQQIAFATAQFIPDANSEDLKRAYNGQLVGPFIGKGDPEAATLTSAYRNGGGGAISDCSVTEYGVSFLRNESWDQPDYVGLVFGKPAAAPPAGGGGGSASNQAQNNTPAQPQTKSCPDGSTIPADQTCPEPPHKCPPGGPQTQVPAGQICPGPTNAVGVHFVPGVLQWTVQLTNSSGVGGNCTYNATDNGGGIGHNDSVAIAPNGKASIQVPPPLPFTSYDVVVSCTGTYDGQQVEFGHNEQTVTVTQHS
jgi:hypothetical protein